MTLAQIAGLVFATELRGLLRDRRALLMAVVLPMVLFPLMFYGMDVLEERTEKSMAERDLVIAQELTSLEPALRATILERLREPERHLTLEVLPPEQTRPGVEGDDWRLRARELMSGERRLLLLGTVSGSEDDVPAELLEIVYDGSDNLANEARQRVQRALADLRDGTRLERLETLLEEDPGAPLAIEESDVAAAEDALGQKLGSLLPVILVLILLSSGSFAALGAFSAEREEGTIETLLVQPVPSSAVAWGKLMAVILTGVVSALGNAAGFVLCLAMGWGESQGLGGDLPLGASAVRLGLGLLLFLPTGVFLSALLCLVAARARSFREGQHYVFPLMMICGLLAAASTQDRLTLNALMALVPVTGATMVLRDTLAGSFQLVPALLSTVSSLVLALLALGQVARTLDNEGLFSTRGSDLEMAARHVQSRRALAFGWASVVLVYLVGGRMQIADPIFGLALTLWVLVPALALLSARGTARRAGESLGRTLGLGLPHPLHLFGAALLAPALVVIVSALVEWQSGYLPFPEGMDQTYFAERFEELSPWALAFLVGLSPGLFEELLFRGAILSGLRRDLSAVKVVLWQAVLFGSVHASVHRFLPTALLGAVLAVLTLRSGRLWPAVVLHTAYNTIAVLEVTEMEIWNPNLALGAGALGLLLLQLGRPRPT